MAVGSTFSGAPHCAVPRLGRARGFRLYDRAGKRYLDLHQLGGGAVLGHRSEGTVKEMKNVLSRGLVGGLPSEHAGRLEKALRRMFPSYGCVRIYGCIHRCLDAVSLYLGKRVGIEDVLDPALDPAPASDGTLSFWRPFLPPGSATDPAVLIPILPLGGTNAFAAACFLTGPFDVVPASDPVPPFQIAGTLKALADLAVFTRADLDLIRSLGNARGWRLKGPYVTPLFEEAAYPAVFRSFLDKGVLLSPEYPGPSILPADTSPGEAQLLRGLFLAHPGG